MRTAETKPSRCLLVWGCQCQAPTWSGTSTLIIRESVQQCWAGRAALAYGISGQIFRCGVEGPGVRVTGLGGLQHLGPKLDAAADAEMVDGDSHISKIPQLCVPKNPKGEVKGLSGLLQNFPYHSSACCVSGLHGLPLSQTAL